MNSVLIDIVEEKEQEEQMDTSPDKKQKEDSLPTDQNDDNEVELAP